MRRTLLLACCALALAGCGNKPRVPDWLVNADMAQERFIRAWLRGEEREAAQEFRILRAAVEQTAQIDLVARAELTRCAVRVAALDFDPCTGLAPLQPHVPAEEQAYAAFLAGEATPAQTELLPKEYRAIAGGAQGGDALKKIKEPVSRLVAAGVLLRTGRADPAVIEAATATASEQGWRRAVLAWLRLQLRRAEQAGATQEAERLRQRIAIAAGESPRHAPSRPAPASAGR